MSNTESKTTPAEAYGPPNPFYMREVSAGILGPDSTFRLLTDGPYRRREIDILIKHLHIVKEALS